MQSETEQRLRVLYREAFAHRRLIVATFVAVVAVMTAIGVTWPKSYRSSTTIFVESRGILDPLMQGAAVRGDIGDQARNAREIIYGRSMMLKVAERAGWLPENAEPAQVEAMLEDLQRRTSISNVGHNLIRIEFRGSDPDRVYDTTEKLAAIFIEEMLASRAKESDAAYRFIDEQVKKYEAELVAAEERLKSLRAANAEARPGADGDSAARVAALRTRIDQLEFELRGAQVRAASLQNQLSGEAETAAVVSRAQEYRTRIAELRNQLENLRLTYHDTYPDIVILKEQIRDLEQKAVAEEQRVSRERSEAARSGRAYIDEALRSNPVYQRLQSELYQVRTEIHTLEARLADAKAKLEQELSRGQRIQEVESQLAQLTRDYEVNQAIYQDLLRRRENARVSMSLNTEQQGLTLRIVEPAYYSHRPSGPRLMHFALGGLALGAVLPLGILFGFLTIDPRVRTGAAISDTLGLPLLETVPRLHTPAEAAAERRGVWLAGLVVLLTVAAVVAVLVLRVQGII